jgi:hypothetical protein
MQLPGHKDPDIEIAEHFSRKIKAVVEEHGGTNFRGFVGGTELHLRVDAEYTEVDDDPPERSP